MPELNRRRFLSHLGIGTALTASGRVPWLLSCLRPDLATIARKLRGCSRDAAFPTAVELLQAGATWKDLLGGTFLAGVQDINPHPIGYRFHAVMMVESAFQLAEQTSPEQRLLPVFYNIDYFKRAQAGDRKNGDWVLEPLPEKDLAMPTAKTPKAAGEAFQKAMLDWDAKRADRAITGLFAATPLDQLFEHLWLFGARDYTAIGHKIIYTAAAYRMLARIGREHGLPVVRSLVLGLLYGSGQGSAIAPFAANRKLAGKLEVEAGWHQGRPDPDASAVVLTKLRQAEVEDAAPIVAELLGRGVTPASIWDGYRLLAADSLMRKPGILPVHPTTSINAMHFAWRMTKRDATRRLLLLQGASWLALFRESFESRLGMQFDKPGIEALKPADTAPKPEKIFREATSDRAIAARQALARTAGGGAKPDFEATVRHLVFTKATETHVYKYAAALLEDYRFCHEVWAPHILAAGVYYLPTAGQEDAAVHRRTVKALKKLER